MTKVRRVTQLQLDGFAEMVRDAEEGGQQDSNALSWNDVKEREMAARRALKDKLAEGEEIPSWAETYHDLINSNVPWRIAAYIAWATVIRKHRWPETQEELAVQVLGLTSDRRITEWRRKYSYIDQMIADIQAAKYLEYIPAAIAASGEVAARADYKSTAERRLLYEATGIIDTKQKVQVEEASLNLGAGRKLLSQLRKQSTAALLDVLGPNAANLIADLEQEFAEEEQEKKEGDEDAG